MLRAAALALALALLAALIDLWPRALFSPAVKPPPVIWQGAEPIIHAHFDPAMRMLIDYDGSNNINGPSLIRTPDWLPGRKGRYYLYFAHHKGKHIRMAYADELQGPWQLYRPGVLRLEQAGLPVEPAPPAVLSTLDFMWAQYPSPILRDFLRLAYTASVVDKAEREARGLAPSASASAHVASPEVIVDHDSKRVLMLYHGLDDFGVQTSRLAVSRDGLHFAAPAQQADLPVAYLRGFDFRGQHYLIGMPGVLLRAEARQGPFELRRRPLLPPTARHTALLRCERTLHIFWSNAGDAPEQILHSQVNLVEDWNEWKASRPQPVLIPKMAWEGAELPARPSLRGELNTAVNELRDPAVFRDSDGSLWLLYTGGGEQAIGLARLQLPDCNSDDEPKKQGSDSSPQQLAAVT
jgi:hypothetical protein